jgi:hypothetical protein
MAEALTEVERAAIAWELTGMLGITIQAVGDGWALDREGIADWWRHSEPSARAQIVRSYRRSVQKEGTDG